MPCTKRERIVRSFTGCGEPNHTEWVRTYDVKRVLPLGDEVYTLRGWDNGWHDLATAVSSDSVSLDFGSVPDYRLFVVYGNTTMGRMQRPFVMVGDSIAYY